MKKSKIRTQLKSQLLFLGFTKSDNSNTWYEMDTIMHRKLFTITIHKQKAINKSVRIYVSNSTTHSFILHYLSLNLNTFNNILKCIAQYEKI